MIDMVVIGAKAITAVWDGAAKTIEKRTDSRARYWGMTVETKVKGRASGRPGPRIITGDYRRSWTTEARRILGGSAFIIGTNKVQGPRLEYGFSGTDSLGRHYNQPPFPHLRPVVAQVEQQYAPDMFRVMVKGL
jgi:hypothetical protein